MNIGSPTEDKKIPNITEPKSNLIWVADRGAMIAFLAVPGIGRKTFYNLKKNAVEMEISLSELWSKKKYWRKAGLAEKQRTALEIFQQNYTTQGFIRFLAEKEIRVITIYDKNYPKLLKEIDDPPLTLYIKGNDIEQEKTTISVVGTRKVTPYGEKVVEKIVAELVGQGVTIVSGFMYGVDYLAHQAALYHGGQTLGVLGFGFDHIYPLSFEGKFQQMLEKGMSFMSEYPPHIRAKKGCFPERNRIVAGLSAGTIVIEAAARSGTSITANLAAEYGRGVFAVPGSIFSPYSEGTRALINNGACLVRSGYEVLEEIGSELFSKGGLASMATIGDMPDLTKDQSDLTMEEEIYQLFKTQGLSIDEISLKMGKSVVEISALLSLMELDEKE